jgi:hypothetical protein
LEGIFSEVKGLFFSSIREAIEYFNEILQLMMLG